ncbi:MAG: S9 family peptidase, partial [Pseudomonadota bacterium]
MRANIFMSMALAIALPLASPLAAQPATTPEATDVPVDPAVFQPVDVFDLEFAADPQISPDGRTIAYVRRSFDRMTDTARSNIWTVDVSSGAHRPILSGTASYSSPRWSPDGKRLAYVTGADRDPQIFVRWMDSGQTARLTELASAPQGLAWAPGGDRLAFTMFVKDKPEPFAKLPTAPEGATWAEPPTVVDDIFYRGDGQGYFEQGTNHLFTVSADGGTARQLTRGDFDHQGAPSW